MSKVLPEDHDHLLAKMIRRNIECADAAANIVDEYHLRPPNPLAKPLEDHLKKWKRDAEEAEAAHAHERSRHDEYALVEARLVTKVAQVIDQRIAELRSDLVDFAEAVSKLIESVSGAIDDLRDAAREPARAANLHLEALLKQLDRKLDELTPHRTRDDDEVIDLPNPLVLHGHPRGLNIV